ncbi:hypothetical protein HNR23_000792 [Nocardiopsis mwathae]|uniref:TrbL/VirB6 plasmid conjugal transfer protein n=1 Tax=Nocardiopsis mwathae TaxID=1472723 RepID=A0A7X0D3Y9_9ACTN|nr:hypothetical protein [Nocardiopsis mwathae]MBB6170732.1 hypothetical protein [Nocardiopsis mwathae]
MIWTVAKTIGFLAIMIYQWAVSGEILSGLNNYVVDLVVSLRQGVWAPYLGVAVIIGALWMGWNGLAKKRATMAVEGAVWMVASTTAAIWILSAPGNALHLGQTTALAGSNVVYSTVAGAGSPDDERRPSCPHVPRGLGGLAVDALEGSEWWPWSKDNASGKGAPARDEMIKRNSNAMWAGFLCKPWLAGQFGTSDKSGSLSREYGYDLLASQAVTRTGQHYIDSGATDEQAVMEMKQKKYEEIAGEVEEESRGVYAILSGERPEARLAIAILALVASVSAGTLVFAVALAVIVLQVVFTLMILVSPFFFLLGVHPGGGRILLMRWVEITLGVLIKQIIAQFLLILIVGLFATVLESALPWGAQMVVLTLVSIAAVLYRKRLTNIAVQLTQAATPTNVIAQVKGGARGADGGQGADGSSGKSGADGKAGASSGPPRRTRWLEERKRRARLAAGAATGGASEAAFTAREQARGKKADKGRSPGAGQQAGSSASVSPGAGSTSQPPASSGADGGGSFPRTPGAGGAPSRVPSGDPGGSGRRSTPEQAPPMSNPRRGESGRRSDGGTSRGAPSQPTERATAPQTPRTERGQTWGDFYQTQAQRKPEV